ncbi:MAG: exodeoxyribonuclease VII small subunit [Planctomycetaceae bacterium]
MAKQNELVADDAQEPSFEHSLEELQLIVKRLEEGDLGLENSLGEYERGIGLLRRCYQLLQQAEQRVEILTGFNDEGEPITQPFDAKATYAPPKGKQERC